MVFVCLRIRCTSSQATAIGILPRLRGEQLFEFRLVESDDRLAVDQRDRGGGEAHAHDFFERFVVLRDVLLGKSNAFLVKELLHFTAEQSAWLRVDDHRLGHRTRLRHEATPPIIPHAGTQIFRTPWRSCGPGGEAEVRNQEAGDETGVGARVGLSGAGKCWATVAAGCAWVSGDCWKERGGSIEESRVEERPSPNRIHRRRVTRANTPARRTPAQNCHVMSASTRSPPRSRRESETPSVGKALGLPVRQPG